MLNIVIPMAGRGSRFAKEGYKNPKPLIDIYGHPMIEWVIKNLTPAQEHRFIFVCQKEHVEKFDLNELLNELAPNCVIIPIDYITDGAACTVLLAEKYIDSNDELMIANSDQFIDYDINSYLNALHENDGLIMTMPASDPKWSFIRYDKDGFVTEVQEKQVISNEATVGIYNFKHGSDFVRYAHQMIDQNLRVNNEFYVAPAYNEMIKDSKKVVYCDIGEKMHGIGIPTDLQAFMRTSVCKNFLKSKFSKLQ